MRIALFSADPVVEDLLDRTLVGSGFEVSRFDANVSLANSQQQPAVILACVTNPELANSQQQHTVQQSFEQLSAVLQQAGQALIVGAGGHIAASPEGPRLTRKQWGSSNFWPRARATIRLPPIAASLRVRCVHSSIEFLSESAPVDHFRAASRLSRRSAYWQIAQDSA